MANYHVIQNDDDKWKVVRERAQRASVFEDTQREAEERAKEFAANSGGGEVRIHGLDGKIRDSDTVSPAKDPFPPKDWKH